MFESLKLRYYKDKAVGMAYTVEPSVNVEQYNVTTYLVVETNNLYSFVEYNRGKILRDKANEVIKNFEQAGYKTLLYYMQLNEEKKSNLQKLGRNK